MGHRVVPVEVDHLGRDDKPASKVNRIANTDNPINGMASTDQLPKVTSSSLGTATTATAWRCSTKEAARGA